MLHIKKNGYRLANVTINILKQLKLKTLIFDVYAVISLLILQHRDVVITPDNVCHLHLQCRLTTTL